jgi:hypothetical protein
VGFEGLSFANIHRRAKPLEQKHKSRKGVAQDQTERAASLSSL